MQYIFKYQSIDQIDKSEVLNSLKKNSFVILRNLFDKKIVRGILKNIKKFDPNKDQIRKKNQYNKLKTNYQRFMFGMSGGVNGLLKTHPKYHRNFYNPLFCKDIYKARGLLIKLAEIQNYFYGLEKNYGIKQKKTKHGLYIASRFQHYPKGGGFLSAHKDEAAIKTARKLKIDLFYNCLLLMTQRGIDYKTGGGFVINKNKVIDYEKYAKAGDVLIYNSKTVHGVIDIDKKYMPDIRTKEGRYIAAVTLFKW